MITGITKAHPSLRIFVFLSVILVLLPAFALSEETYKFERMWPTIQQSWYFNNPFGIAIGESGNIYVADTGNNRIQKFTPEGTLITQWGKEGSGDGDFKDPQGIAIDKTGNIYIAEGGNNRIQKFNSNGEFIRKWGSAGPGDGEFSGSAAVAVDGNGNVYVADMHNNRIQKFTSDGDFITKWGNFGAGNGQFSTPSGIATDSSGNVYVVEFDGYRVQKFTSDGQFVAKWGSLGSGDGEFTATHGIATDGNGNVYVPDTDYNLGIQKFTSDGVFIVRFGGVGSGLNLSAFGLAVDTKGNIYVAEPYNNRIQKLTSDGALVARWGSDGSGDGEFFEPRGLILDGSQSLYVADGKNDRIQKFNPDGEFIAKWKPSGSEDGVFYYPYGMAIDDSGNIYTVEKNANFVRKFSPSGQLLAKWGSLGTGDGEFKYPGDIATDSGNVYVVDSENNRIQKFNSDGQFITKWGRLGTEDGQFSTPSGIATDSSGNVYIVDFGNNRIQKFNSNGQFLGKWGESGTGDGGFDLPEGIAIDDSGNVYIADTRNNRIQKFTSDGQFITKFGEHGFDQGQFSGPTFLCVSNTGRVYVSDTHNNRIQVFSKEGSPVSDTSKAIIVAGGGPFSGNNLWDATQMCANYAYRALTYQGYNKDTIYYLSSDTDFDLDGNGKLDDVDADATNSNLEYAIKTWAFDAEDLFIYMVDHGGNGTFRMSGTEILKATDLDAWLDTIQQTLPGCVTMVYDACESGSFLPYLLPPAGKQRILATSTSVGEESIFVGNGTVSFSFLFWGHMFNGDSFYDAFVNAKQSVSTTYNLTPQLDGDGNGIGNEKADKDAANLIRVGNETKSAGDVPVIGGVSPAQALAGATSAKLYAEHVIDADGISRVWAVITPPGYSSGSTETPVTDLPTIDLSSVGNNRFEATYTSFTSSGTYNIAVFAMDRKGVLSLPVQTTVATTLNCLAVASDLSIRVPCAEYNGNPYGFIFVFHRNPDDPSGYYWTLPMATLTTGEGADCIPIVTDLSMSLSCVAYNGTQYGFTLRFYNNPYDPSGLYWKMDMSTLEVK